MSIGAFTPDELQAVANLQEEYRTGVYIVTPAFRLGLAFGVRRALDAAREAKPGEERAAVERLLDP